MTEHAFHKTQADHCVFVKRYDGGDFLILLLYVDNMLIIGQDAKKVVTKSFTMKTWGWRSKSSECTLIGVRQRGYLWLSQQYVKKVL